MNRKITFLGTGAAILQKTLHASFVLEWGNLKMLVDTMGGYDIIKALKTNHIDLTSLNTLFISHRHLDHALGFPWIVRMVRSQALKSKSFPADFRLQVLCSPHVRKSVEQAVQAMCPDYWDVASKYISFTEIQEGTDLQLFESLTFQPLDLESEKEEQHGFILKDSEFKLTFTGDETLRGKHHDLAMDSDVLIHEAFCLDAEEAKYGAHEKYHSTALEAARNAVAINAKHLVLIHLADEEPERKERYAQEISTVYQDELTVPNDGEELILSAV